MVRTLIQASEGDADLAVAEIAEAVRELLGSGKQVSVIVLDRDELLSPQQAGELLGAGFLTFIPMGATYVLFAVIASWANVTAAVAAGAAFGATRAGAVGPAALAAEASSRVLYRSRFAHIGWPKLSAVASLGLAFYAIGVLAV